MNYTAIILAGGKSDRFGTDKTLLRINGELIIECIINRCKKLFAEIIIVSNESNKFNIPGVKEISDIYPGHGPLGGIHAGLLAASNEVCFVTACDMPLFYSPLAEYILSKSNGYDIVLPKEKNNHFQPLFAVYRKNLLSQAEKLLMRKSCQVLNLCKTANVRYIDEPDWKKRIRGNTDVFFNINSPEDYRCSRFLR